MIRKGEKLNQEMKNKTRKKKFIKALLIIVAALIIFSSMAIIVGKKRNAEADKNDTADGYYECMENPVDSLFAEALHDSHVMVEYHQIQELYYDTWKTQYDNIMGIIRNKCKYEEDIANYELFTKEMEEGFEYLQPLILNEMLDNYDMPESPEKNSWGNGTQDRLLMYQGTMYRNACMFFIPLLEENEYVFPLGEIEQALSEIIKGH